MDGLSVSFASERSPAKAVKVVLAAVYEKPALAGRELLN